MRDSQNPLKEIDDDLWVVDSKFALPRGHLPIAVPGFLGKCRIRMTVVRLSSKGLLLHSPTKPNPSLVEDLGKLGKVEWIIGPNVKHNTFLLPWAKLFPTAKIQVAPRTARRIPELTGYLELNDETPVSPADLRQKFLIGHRSYETLFLHAKSKTLIATDSIYNIQADSDLLERVYYKIFGAYGKPGVLSYHSKLITDKNTFRSSLAEVLG